MAKNGELTYYHQMLGAALVHPDLKEVIPLMPEPIIKQDGETKNDCEGNAAKRFFHKLRHDHPHLGLIVVEDALSSNAPHIRELHKHNLHYLSSPLILPEGCGSGAKREHLAEAGCVSRRDLWGALNLCKLPISTCASSLKDLGMGGLTGVVNGQSMGYFAS